jgi:hypothetical protein
MHGDNPYKPSTEQRGLRSQHNTSPRNPTTIFAVLLIGACCGFGSAIAAIVLGFHGNYIVECLYILGPIIWALVAFRPNDSAYLVIVLTGMVLIMTGYSYFVAISRWSSWELRLFLVVLFHALCGMVYHLTIGI